MKNEPLKIYQQIKKLEKKFETAGKIERARIMKKCLVLEKRLNLLTGKREK